MKVKKSLCKLIPFFFSGAALLSCTSQFNVGVDPALAEGAPIVTITEFLSSGSNDAGWSDPTGSDYSIRFLEVDSQPVLIKEKFDCHVGDCGSGILQLGKGTHEITARFEKDYYGRESQRVSCRVEVEKPLTYTIEFAKRQDQKVLFIPEMVRFVSKKSGEVLVSSCKTMDQSGSQRHLQSAPYVPKPDNGN